MDIKAKVGDLTLVKSDSLLINDNQKVSIVLDDEYTLEFSFVDDPNKNEQGIDLGPEKKGGLEFILQNFNKPLGTAIAKPFEFAKKNGQPLYIALCVYAIGPSKLFHYNLFVKK